MNTGSIVVNRVEAGRNALIRNHALRVVLKDTWDDIVREKKSQFYLILLIIVYMDFVYMYIWTRTFLVLTQSLIFGLN